MTIDEEQALFQWANRQWPNRALPDRLRKLGEEVGELNEAVARHLQTWEGEVTKMNILDECADVANILVDICHLLGGSLIEAQRAKFPVLLERERTRGETTRADG